MLEESAKVPIPPNEADRLAALRLYEILDTPPEKDFDDITRLAAYICDTPIALVSFVDAERQWFKSRVGLEMTETPRDVAFCAHAILERDLFVVPDTTADSRFRSNPMVTGAPFVRFYAALPLVTPDGHVVGTLCVKDIKPREISAEQVHTLRALSRQVVLQLELKRKVAELEKTIADKERVESALRDQTSFLQTILTHSADAIIVTDRSKRLRLINPAARKLARGDLTGSDIETNAGHWGETYDARGLVIERGKDPLDLALQGVVTAEEEIRIVHSDGVYHDLLVSAAPYYDERGEIDGAVANAKDITVRRKREQEVEEERRRLQALVDTSPVGVVVAETGTRRILLANREALRLLRIQQHADDRLDRYERAVAYRRPDGRAYGIEEMPLQRAMATGESIRAEEIQFDYGDGRSALALVSATPVFSSEGKITSAIVVMQDMSSLQEAERLRNEFLGMVSHELRTPLTVIKGSAALGARRVLGAEQNAELFQMILEQADRLNELVGNLLDMSRIEAGALSVSQAPVDIHRIVEEAAGNFARAGGTQTVAVRLNSDLPAVMADSRRITQVIGNLLGNAGKASAPASTISIDGEVQGLLLTLHVHDEGIGLSPDSLAYLFKKFSRIPGGPREQLAGTGLGLAICRGIVEAHGGRIWAQSDGPGKGATFSFTLPVATQRRNTLPRPALNEAEDGPRRVAVIDDDQSILRLLQALLEKNGYEALVETDPKNLEQMLLQGPCAVLLDLMMPGVSGFEVLEDIRRVSSVPVIFITARDQEEDMRQAIEKGAQDYITKPFSPSELLSRLDAVIRQTTA